MVASSDEMSETLEKWKTALSACTLSSKSIAIGRKLGEGTYLGIYMYTYACMYSTYIVTSKCHNIMNGFWLRYTCILDYVHGNKVVPGGVRCCSITPGYTYSVHLNATMYNWKKKKKTFKCTVRAHIRFVAW